MPPRYTPRGRDDPYGDVPQAQEFAMQGVEGYGEALRPHLLREIGTALGGLNEIGALRSGGANVALSDISTNYAQQIGAFAKQASGQALGYGLEAGRLRFEREQARAKKKAGLLKAIGSVLGAGIGFFASGMNPAGAAAGATIGGGATPGWE